MRKTFLKYLMFTCLASPFLLCQASFADWNPGDPHKWLQSPDLTTNGIDICMDDNGGRRAIGDDFQCTETGPITDVHLWVSWKSDITSEIPGITLSIYSNNPSGPGGFSQPGALLWQRMFTPGQFTSRLYYTLPDVGEYWWDPRSGLFIANGDKKIWQLNFNINPTEAYVQQGSPTNPIIYWLVVEPNVPPGVALGWKTRQYPDHFMDDAVWRSNDTPTPWVKLEYQPGHPYYGNSIDMAFVITTQQTQPSTMDFGDANQPPYPTTLAANGARHTIVPGILMGALIDSEADGQPNATATGDDISGLDDEDGVTFTTALMPGNWATVNVDLTSCVAGIGLFLNAWVDFSSNGSWADPGDQIFTNQAVTTGSINSLTFWVPAAAQAGKTTFARFRLSTLQGLSYTGAAPDGEVEDYAVPILKKHAAEHLKWSQPPLEMYPQNIYPEYCGWNEQSWTQNIEELIPQHRVADDFRCLGSMPVTSIHWWGSFMNWTSESLPPIMPTEWNVKFYANVPDSNFSHPGAVLWEVTIPSMRVCTDYNGIDYHSYYGMESCFQHYVQLKPDEYFRQGQYDSNTTDHTYWLGITAVYPQGMTIPYPWGWKTRPQHWMDDAVKYECRIVGWEPNPDPQEPPIPIFECKFWPMEDPITLESVDAAFELDTDPNYIKWEQPYTGIRKWPSYEDQPSMAFDDGNNLTINRQVADDWLCKKRTPITSLVWWGSYLNYHYIPCQTPMMPVPVKPLYFMINIWTDVPATSGPDPNHSHPGVVVWGYKAYNYDEAMVGYDKNPVGAPQEPVFRYSVRLPQQNWFKQRKVNQIYWVSIVAVYNQPPPPPTYPWGWTNHKHFYNDDAVAGHLSGTTWVWDELFDDTGISADQSFILFTDPSICVSCADYDFSGLVNFKDYARFALDWLWSGQPGGYDNADLDCDGDVDNDDLKIFCNQWLQPCP